ncbi:MAG: hypothetical protein QE271_01450 [Bacteriovoracaceae bacterium]|nr:hypothetical protein [Bacteriovoracaceae bacterium]
MKPTSIITNLLKIVFFVFIISLGQGCNKRASQAEVKDVPVVYYGNSSSLSASDLETPGSRIAKKEPNKTSDAALATKNETDEFIYVDTAAKGKLYYKKDVTLDVGGSDGKEYLKRDVVTTTDSPNGTTQSPKLDTPSSKRGGDFTIPVRRFVFTNPKDQSQKSIYLVASAMKGVSEDFKRSATQWLADTATKIKEKGTGANNGELVVRYEKYRICNEEDNGHVYFPAFDDLSFTNTESKNPIFLRDRNKGNKLEVNPKLFTKYAKCSEIKPVYETDEREQSNSNSETEINAEYFNSIKEIYQNISAVADDLTQNELTEDYKGKLIVENVCSRFATTLGPHYCPYYVGNSSRELQSQDFKNMVSEIFWNWRTEYYIYSSLKQLGLNIGEKQKAEFEAKFKLSLSENLKPTQDIVLFLMPGHFAYAAQLLEGAGLKQDFEYEAKNQIYYGRCVTGNTIVINNETRRHPLYKEWEAKCTASLYK